MGTLDLNSILQAVNAAGTVGVFIVLFVLFMRGDLLSRKVWEELTKQVIEQTVDRIANAVCEKLNAKK